MPNERWQADITHWRLADGTEVEILNMIDDHSRLLVASDALAVFKAADVVACFHRAAAAHGFPASLLTDNGAVFTAAPRGGRCAIELETARLGIRIGALAALPPADLRQGRAPAPDAQAVPRPARTPADNDRRAPGPARPVPRLLQHVQPAPGDRAADTRGGVRCPAQGRPVARQARRARAVPAAPGQGRHHRGRDASSTTHGCTTSGSGASSSARGSWSSSMVCRFG